MVDWMDRAQEDQEAHEERALAAQLRKSRPSIISRMCMSCGDEIPELRRAALPGCCLCVECQADLERVLR